MDITYSSGFLLALADSRNALRELGDRDLRVQQAQLQLGLDVCDSQASRLGAGGLGPSESLELRRARVVGQGAGEDPVFLVGTVPQDLGTQPPSEHT